VKTQYPVLFLLLSLILSGCGPTGTPFAGPDISGRVGVVPSAVSVVSASVSPASFAYAYKCGSTSVPPAILTFTVLIEDPGNLVVVVRATFKYDGHAGSTTTPFSGKFPLTLAGTSGSVKTYSGSTEDLNTELAAHESGAAENYHLSAIAYGKASAELAYTDLFLIPFAACRAPLAVRPGPVLPPFALPTDTSLPPTPAGKPKGGPPSCSAQPNNPNCKP
jgi:hypothetical protein